MLVQILVQVIAFAVGALTAFILAPQPEIRRRIGYSLLSGLISATVVNLVMINNGLCTLDKIARPNALALVDDYIGSLSLDDLIFSSAVVRRDFLREELRDLQHGRIRLHDADEVLKERARCMEHAATRMDAVCVLDPASWREESDAGAKLLQSLEAAKSRGVRIRRVFVSSAKSQDEAAVIEAIGEKQRATGAEVKFLKYESLLTSPSYIKCLPAINGSSGFELYDINVALLSFTNPETLRVESGALTMERSVVDAARDLFETMWALSTDKVSIGSARQR
jgi:hypothetical protein